MLISLDFNTSQKYFRPSTRVRLSTRSHTAHMDTSAAVRPHDNGNADRRPRDAHREIIFLFNFFRLNRRSASFHCSLLLWKLKPNIRAGTESHQTKQSRTELRHSQVIVNRRDKNDAQHDRPGKDLKTMKAVAARIGQDVTKKTTRDRRGLLRVNSAQSVDQSGPGACDYQSVDGSTRRGLTGLLCRQAPDRSHPVPTVFRDSLLQRLFFRRQILHLICFCRVLTVSIMASPSAVPA